MTKAELVEAVAKKAGLTKVQAEKAVAGFTEAVTETLKKGDKVMLVGFGTFSVGERAARTGKNPKTGQAIEVKASKSPKFKAGAGLKEAVS